MSATTQERQEAILAEVYKSGRVTIKDIATQFRISEPTVRRDLKSLSDAGQLELAYGGATLPRHSDFSFKSKGMRNIEAKRIIGELAAELVKDGDQIFMDSGTTCFQMVPHLNRRRDLTIIMDSTRLAPELHGQGLTVIMLGGQYRPARLDTVGPLAIRTLENLRGYVAYVGADGLNMDFGLSASDAESAALYAVAVANARKTVLIVDHSKFLSPSLHKIADFGVVSTVVTDKRPGEDWMQFLAEKGIDVIYPPQEKRIR
ncbi:MAG: DeoR/GlpR family DNA-binding transcription regulator [Candidatus Sumerlaeota bacterium]|nr:DeoR/GlpR family DNA-binding transcription regulator [Candidatus Sumerlaeota bacterium]